jgi:hypothetical protein
MFFLKKSVNSEDFSKMLFELFLKELRESNNYKNIFDSEKPPKFFEEEIPMFLVFLILYVIDQKIKEKQKRDAIASSFLQHIKNHFLAKFGNNENEASDFLETIKARCDEYEEALQNNKGAGPLWHLSRKAINNIFGEDILSAVLVDQFTAIYVPLWEYLDKKTGNLKIT